MKKRRRLFSLVVVNVLLIVFLTVHTVLLVFDTGPTNPLSVQVNRYSTYYIDPLFTQNWHLFAPEPLTVNYNLLLQVKLKKGSELARGEWIDITSPMKDLNRSNVLTPFNRMLRIGDSLINKYFNGNHEDVVYKLKNKNTDEKIDEEIKKMEDKVRKKAEEEIFKFASSYAKSLYPERDIDSIKVMIEAVEPVPFSKRNEKNFEPERRYVEFDWQPIDSEVVAFK